MSQSNLLIAIKNFIPPKYTDFINNQEIYKEYFVYMKYSNKIKNKIILDIGTDAGLSALFLGFNGLNNVISYDVVNFGVHSENKQKLSKTFPNIKFKIENLLNNPDQTKILFKSASIILIDVDPHDGEQERLFYALIKQSEFKGITIWDDIHLNDGMENFWNEIVDKKEDLTNIGHYTGTGLINIK